MTTGAITTPTSDHLTSQSRDGSVSQLPAKPQFDGEHGTFTNSDPLPTQTVEQILAGLSEQGPKEWLVDGLLPVGAFSVVYGAPKCGKTTLLAYLCAALVGKGVFLGRDVQVGPVLWLDLEQSVGLTADVLNEAGAVDHEYQVHVFNGAPPRCQDIRAKIKAVAPIAIVVDSLSRFLELENENDASEMNRELGPLYRMVRDTGISLFAIHHDRKREGKNSRNMRGSTALAAMADLSCEVRQGSEDHTQRALHITTRYRGLPDRLSVRLTDEGYVQCSGPENVRDSQVLSVLTNQAVTTDELGIQLGMSRQGMGIVLKRLESSGEVVRIGTGKRGDPYRFQLSGDSESVRAALGCGGLADSMDTPNTRRTTLPVDDGDF